MIPIIIIMFESLVPLVLYNFIGSYLKYKIEFLNLLEIKDTFLTGC